MSENALPLTGVFEIHDPVPMIAFATFFGVLFGLCLDLSKGTRFYFSKNKILESVIDFLAVILAYLLLFCAALNYNDGIVRLYHIIFFVVGYYLYSKLLSRMVMFLIERPSKLIKALIKASIRISLIPARLLLKAIVTAFKKTSYAVARIRLFVVYILKKHKFAKMASKGFNLANAKGAKQNIKTQRKRYGTEKNWKNRRNRHIAGDNFSDNRLHKTANGIKPTAQRAR